MDLEKLKKNVTARGMEFFYAQTAEEARRHILEQVQNTTVGIGGSKTVDALGLSSVRIARIDWETPAIEVLGADLMDGTPIYDIKPYIPYADSVPDAASGFAPDEGRVLDVDFPDSLLAAVPAEKRAGLLSVLAHDPRPRYQDDPDRVYGMAFAGLDIRFRVNGGTLQVTGVVLPETAAADFGASSDNALAGKPDKTNKKS